MWESVVCAHATILCGHTGFLTGVIDVYYNTTQAGIQALKMYVLSTVY